MDRCAGFFGTLYSTRICFDLYGMAVAGSENPVTRHTPAISVISTNRPTAAKFTSLLQLSLSSFEPYAAGTVDLHQVGPGYVQTRENSPKEDICWRSYYGR